MSEQQRHTAPPLWDRLPKHIRGTRIRTSTAILVVLFVILLWWYLDLRVQFVPEEQRRTGMPPVTTTVAPRTTPDYTGPASTSLQPSSTPASGASASTGPSGASQASGAPQASGGAPSSGAAPSGTTTPGGISIPGLPPVTIPGLPGQGGATTGAAPTTTVAPS